MTLVDLSNFDSSKVINIYRMFYNCNKLKEIKGLPKFKANNAVNMSAIFNCCNKLKEIKEMNKFNSKNVIKIVNNKFQNFNELISLCFIKF